MKKSCIFSVLQLLCVIILIHVPTETSGSTVFTDPPSFQAATSFAIIVDSTTFVKSGNLLLQYRQAIENDGLPTSVIMSNWTHPQQIRDIIQKLRQQSVNTLEGFVLVGNIPIIMLRDAQHLTSAFRMNQDSRAFIESSVPTDRYYDDLKLKCKFIQQDNKNPKLFYYQLEPDSPVQLHRNLYSARIPLPDSRTPYKTLNKYLTKIVKIKNSPPEPLDNIVVMTGFNYLSEAHSALIDEVTTLRTSLGFDKKLHSRIAPMSFAMTANPKKRLLNYLSHKSTDMLLLHSHGNAECQYLLEPTNRGIIIDENSAVISAPETRSPKFDDGTLCINEIRHYPINSEFVILDVCYNGAFHERGFVAADYLFSPGEVVTVMANSVNVRQDIGIIKNLGALSYGARIGHWHQLENYLETHLFGDPTYHFESGSNRTSKITPPFERYEKAPVNLSVFKNIFRSSDDPYLRASALCALHKFKSSNFEAYRKQALKDPANIVRLHAWLLYAQDNPPDFARRLPEGLDDNYELIRRYAATWMGEIGNNSFVQHLAITATNDPSERVVFNALISLKLIGTHEAQTALVWVLKKIEDYDNGKFVQQVKSYLTTMTRWLPNDVLPPMTQGTSREKIDNIRLFRANRHQVALPILIFLYENDRNVGVRKAAADAMGWYGFYEKRNLIIQSFQKQLNDPTLPTELRETTAFSMRRLTEGPNNSHTP